MAQEERAAAKKGLVSKWRERHVRGHMLWAGSGGRALSSGSRLLQCLPRPSYRRARERSPPPPRGDHCGYSWHMHHIYFPAVSLTSNLGKLSVVFF